MKIPQGLDVSSPDPSHPIICKLNKSLYGPKKASRQ